MSGTRVAPLIGTEPEQLRAALVRAYDWFREIPEKRWTRVDDWRAAWERDDKFFRDALGLQDGER